MKMCSVERPAKQLPGLNNLSYPERLRKLKLPTLTFRRIHGDMIELYKILSGKYNREAAPFVKLWKDMTSRTGVRGNIARISESSLPRNQRKTNFLNFKLLRRTAKYQRKSTTLNTEIIRINYQELRNSSQTEARCFRLYLDIRIFEFCFTTLKSWTFLSRH